METFLFSLGETLASGKHNFHFMRVFPPLVLLFYFITHYRGFLPLLWSCLQACLLCRSTANNCDKILCVFYASMKGIETWTVRGDEPGLQRRDLFSINLSALVQLQLLFRKHHEETYKQAFIKIMRLLHLKLSIKPRHPTMLFLSVVTTKKKGGKVECEKILLSSKDMQLEKLFAIVSSCCWSKCFDRWTERVAIWKK